MKSLKAFIIDLKNDKKLAEKVNAVSTDSKKIVEIAKTAGYEVTVAEIADLLMEAVSGGGFFSDLGDFLDKYVPL